ncbi:MAG TPA: hypothetical protein VKT30_04440 [Caulobacteraceae bacterium]|nr:hypothetical protein [Caulobacteraceae bacterium]
MAIGQYFVYYTRAQIDYIIEYDLFVFTVKIGGSLDRDRDVTNYLDQSGMYLYEIVAEVSGRIPPSLGKTFRAVVAQLRSLEVELADVILGGPEVQAQLQAAEQRRIEENKKGMIFGP